MKDFRYIIKRIIIGVGIALVLGFLRGNLLIGVSAKEITSVWAPLSTNTYVVNNLSTSVSATSSGRHWANWGYGILRFNFSLIKVSGASTSALVVPKEVNVNNYACNIGTTSFGNSTFTGSTYSVECPMIMGSNGLEGVYIGLTDFQANANSDYRITFGGMFTFEKVEDQDLSSVVSAINNQTTSINNNIDSEIQSQTQSILNNQNQNAQNIQDTINSALGDDCINAQTVHPTFTGVALARSGTNFQYYTSDSNSGGVYDVSAYVGKEITVSFSGLGNHNPRTNYCVGPVQAISSSTRCLVGSVITSSSTSGSYTFTVPENGKYLYVVGYNNYTDTTWVNNVSISLPKVCRSKIDRTTDAVNQVNSSVNNINNNINNTNVSEANSEASSFFDNFSASSHGLSGIITAPIRLLNAFTTASCSPLEFNLPFVGNHVVLPCMKGIYQSYFGVFFTLWQMITTGVICWNVSLNFYKKVHDLQNPKNDRIEVLSL